MPLRAGASPTILRANIAEAVKSFKRTGRFGNSKPGSMKQALRQITAAAYAEQRKTIAQGGK